MKIKLQEKTLSRLAMLSSYLIPMMTSIFLLKYGLKCKNENVLLIAALVPGVNQIVAAILVAVNGLAFLATLLGMLVMATL